MSVSGDAIRPDKARIVCENCGHEFEARGNPMRVVPHEKVPANCSQCPVNGTIVHDERGYISHAIGDIRVERQE